MRLIALLFSLSLSANHYDYVYKTQNATAFYDAQTEQEFLNLKHQAYGQVVWSAISPILTVTSAYWAYQHWAVEPEERPAVTQAAVAFGAVGFFLSQLFSGLIQTYSQTIPCQRVNR